MSAIYKSEKNNKLNHSSDLRHVLFKPKSLDQSVISQALYNFWHKEWSNAFKEINYSSHLPSDDFYRQYEVAGLLHKDQVIAIVLFDWFDLTKESHLNHSYFKHHPPEAIQKFHELRIHKTLTISYLAVDSLWRKNFNIAQLIIGLCTKRFQQSSFNHMITYSRNHRRTNDLIYEFGALPILTNVEVRNEPSDFVYFTKESTEIMSTHPLSPLIEDLWQKRIQDPNIINDQPNKSNKGDTNEDHHLLNSL